MDFVDEFSVAGSGSSTVSRDDVGVVTRLPYVASCSASLFSYSGEWRLDALPGGPKRLSHGETKMTMRIA